MYVSDYLIYLFSGVYGNVLKMPPYVFLYDKKIISSSN